MESEDVAARADAKLLEPVSRASLLSTTTVAERDGFKVLYCWSIYD
jgi:hypothetical protein